MLWKERNDKTSDRSVRTLAEVLDWAVDEIVAWFHAGFRRLQPVISALGSPPGRAFSHVIV